MTEQVYFEDVSRGDEIPPLTVTVDPARMSFFSAATYNGHRIHYDRSWAVDVEGHQDIVVHGPLQAALLARAITDWAGGAGRLVHGQALVDLAVRGEKGDAELLVPGTATVSLPKRS
jgi:acyl dehydratase